MLPLRKISHRALFFISRSVYMTCCCGCCSALRPRYKRLVDHIFPAYPHDGLVKANMEKLVFYSVSSPEKLDRIGEYLFQKASRDIYRRRHGFVIIAMEAMDQLLVACHSQTLNLFVESFLKMVQKLLESPDPELQKLATQSFVRFANIEEDTPSYHRRYDFFVSKFSAMCHSNHSDPAIRDKIRLAGIQGLLGVIRKTVSDDLVENIWEPQHMEKIVPSLLYNMQSTKSFETVGADSDTRDGWDEDPPRLAEACLRELLGRAPFTHIRTALTPVLTHFDRHQLWVPNDFAVYTFKVIMFSVQGQYSYSVVETLMQHVDVGVARVRAARCGVLADIVHIANASSVGPSVLEIINNLLTNLRASVARDTEKDSGEKLYQEALINALGEFADHLPDFQKIDIMMFIVSKIPSAQRNKISKADALLQNILLKSLLRVGTTYRTKELHKAFPAAFLEALLRVAHADGALAQTILHTLLDTNQLTGQLTQPLVDYSSVGLTMQKCSRQDLIFFSKHGFAIFSSLYEGLQKETNTLEDIEAIYTTIALLFIQLSSEETVCDMLHLVYAIQQSALVNPVATIAQQCQLHSVAISLACLLPYGLPLSNLQDYLNKVVKSREAEAPYLIPPLLEHYDVASEPKKLPFLMMDLMAISECVKRDGVDPARLQAPCPYMSASGGFSTTHSWLEAGAAQGRDSLADIAAPGTEVDSANSSPGVTRPTQYDDLDEEYRMFLEKFNRNYRPMIHTFGVYRVQNDFWNWGRDDTKNFISSSDLTNVSSSEHEIQTESITVEALRRAASGPSEADKREAEKKKMTLNDTFRNAPFETLMTLTQPKYEIKDKLEEIFKSISEEPLIPTSPTGKYQSPQNKYYQDLFLY